MFEVSNARRLVLPLEAGVCQCFFQVFVKSLTDFVAKKKLYSDSVYIQLYIDIDELDRDPVALSPPP